MRDLVIYGAGGFGRETAFMVQQINASQSTWNVIGFYDDGKVKGETIDGLPVLGGIKDLNEHRNKLDVVLAVSTPLVRRKIRSQITSAWISFPSLIHPRAMTGDMQRNFIGEGVILTAGNILTTNIRIQAFAIVNLACTIGHDVVIGEYCSLMPGCSVSGSVSLESGVLLGTGARILPGLTIGECGRVGAGAVVTRNVPADTTVVGIPARPIVKK